MRTRRTRINRGFIEGPGITYQSVANTATATPSQSAPAIANTNGSLAGSAAVTSPASPPTASVLNGTATNAGATGPDNTTATDFTAANYTNGGTILGAVTGTNVSVPTGAAALSITNAIANNGNKDDTYALTSVTATGAQAVPTGWSVTFVSTGQAASGTCAAVTAGTTIASLCVPSGGTGTYVTRFTPPAATATSFAPYVPYGVTITATSGLDATTSNATTDEFFVGGFVKLTKTVADAASQTCAAATTFSAPATSTALPGDCLQYVVTYANVMPSLGTGSGSIAVTATGLAIVEDGAASSSSGVAYANTWAANTNGLFAVPVDTNGGTLGGYSGAGAAGSTKFTDTIASLAPAASGSVTFKVQVK